MSKSSNAESFFCFSSISEIASSSLANNFFSLSFLLFFSKKSSKLFCFCVLNLFSMSSKVIFCVLNVWMSFSVAMISSSKFWSLIASFSWASIGIFMLWLRSSNCFACSLSYCRLNAVTADPSCCVGVSPLFRSL